MKILVVDDDRVVADLVVFTVRRAGYEAILASDAASALRRWTEDQPDLILLDINLPGTAQLKDGFAICQHIRSQSDVPIILLTVRGEEDDIVHGLEAGADDYVLKPFSPRQLVARIQAVMRRGRPMEASSSPARLSMDGLDFNPKLREVSFSDGTTKSLTSLENRLLEYLMLNAGHVLTTDDLISDVWGVSGGNSEMLRQLVRRLRAKIESDPTKPYYIQNLPGLGYAFRLKR
ncbi:MAG TPA: response regulator transcription factor [Anaerolineales bacterium]|nr:response regulator transcription factor [Anaerolineales bacterium]